MESSQNIIFDNKSVGLLKYKIINKILTITYFSIYQEYRKQNIGKNFLKNFIANLQDIQEIHLLAYGEIGNENKLFQYYQDIGFTKNGKEYVNTTTTGDYIVQPMIIKIR